MNKYSRIVVDFRGFFKRHSTMQRQETRTSGHKVYLNQLVKAIVLFLIILLMIFITALNYYLIERHRSHVHSELTAAFYDEAQILQDKVNYSCKQTCISDIVSLDYVL